MAGKEFRRYPFGKLNEHDEGEIGIAIGARHATVVMEFPKTVKWIGFPPEQAEEIAELLKKWAQEARKQRQ